MLQPAVQIGTISGDTTRVIGVLPEDGDGLTVRKLGVYLTSHILSDSQDYWRIELGVFDSTGTFKSRAKPITTVRGLPDGMNFVGLTVPARYNTGETIAVRFKTFGTPTTLTGLSVVLITDKRSHANT